MVSINAIRAKWEQTVFVFLTVPETKKKFERLFKIFIILLIGRYISTAMSFEALLSETLIFNEKLLNYLQFPMYNLISHSLI